MIIDYKGTTRHTLWKMEKISRHKHNPNLPVCKLHVPGSTLVR